MKDMKLFWKKVKRFFTIPFFTPTIDRFIVLGFAFIGAFTGSFSQGVIPLWQVLLYVFLFLAIVMPILRVIGNKWRKKRGIEEKDMKPNKRVERILLNTLLGIAIALLVFVLVLNLLADFFSWIWVGLHVFVVLIVYISRFIHLRRLERS
ncbi:hypothetical protein [Oceanobacillus locisalsi]|uniref:DUF3796 domain-containing protein n=1 Tax=Oceanobacillus locisalsi TaxID=546107 RepID=A0ABW3NDH1_9BACI